MRNRQHLQQPKLYTEEPQRNSGNIWCAFQNLLKGPAKVNSTLPFVIGTHLWYQRNSSSRHAVHDLYFGFFLHESIVTTFEMIKICYAQKSADLGSCLQCLYVNTAMLVAFGYWYLKPRTHEHAEWFANHSQMVR